MDEFERMSFKNRDEWRKWLKGYHAIARGVWLIYFKKHTGKPSVSYNEAVEEALCFGWIDSLIKRIDDERYMQKFTPRHNDSTWSETNRNRVDKMINLGKMTRFGLKKIEIAKQNGKWEEKENLVQNFTLSEDLLGLLKNDPFGITAFEMLPPSHKKQYVLWIMSAKREETRKRRMKKMIIALQKGERMF